jgi:ATP-dependent helicase/nuclease subunit A
VSAADPALTASDPLVSAWVSANAGSGKTYVLTARVIRLLLDGTPPGRLLCLTYTRAAAAEMRARVFKTLGAWALMEADVLSEAIAQIEGTKPSPDRLARARRLFATALETPGGLKIQTIHAFCERLVARFPVEAEAPVPFTVLTEAEAATMKAAARMRALETLGAEASGTLMEALAPYLNADGFAALFEGRTAGLIARYGESDPWALAGLPYGTTPGEVVDEAGFDDPERVAFFHRAADILNASGRNDQWIGKPLALGLARNDPDERFAHITAAFTKGDGGLRDPLGTKGLRAAHPQLFAALDVEGARAFDLAMRRAAAESATMAHAVATLGRGIAGLYAEAKRARGKLDFDDLIQAALYLLRDSGAAQWALYKLDGGLDHILIDEAQDTSPAQWAVVERLAEEFFAGAGQREAAKARPRTLFAVGDEKQSIFSFQGADPTSFARFREIFSAKALGAGGRFEATTLATSRRSVPAVLALADAVFAEDEELRRAVSGGVWAHHVAHRASSAGAVELWPLVEAEDSEASDDWTRPVDAPPPDDPATRLAGVLAETIKSWIGRESIEDGETCRPLRAGDVLILVRTRGRLQKALIRKLKQAGVPVAGADRLQLLDHIAVKDLIAYGRAALLPQDDLNLAALLRSPFFDVSEDDLFALAHGRSSSLWARLAEAAADNAALAAIRDALTHAINRLGRDSPFDFYARLLAGGGRRAMLARLGEEAEDVIDEFLAAAAAFEETGPLSLEGFLHALETTGGEVKRDPDAAGGAVRVLTAHGAKGLEAPVVILPDTMSLPSATHTPDLLEYEGALVWKPSRSPEAEAAKLAYQAAEHDEHKRLLYVALTRPRDRLIVCGVKPGKATAKTATTWYQAIEAGFGRLAAATIDTPVGPGRRFGTLGGAMTAPIAPETVKPLPDWTQAKAPQEEPIGLVRPSRLTPDLVFGDAAAGYGLERGRLIHRLLQGLPELAPAEREAAAARFLAARGAMLDAAERAEIAARLLAILDDPRFAAAFAPGSRAEAAIAGRVKALGASGFISGQIDRLAVSAEGVFIVDYKTNRAPPVRADDTPAAYLKQLALYREAMRAAFPGRAVRCALLWTETPALMVLPDSLLDAALARLAAA